MVRAQTLLYLTFLTFSAPALAVADEGLDRTGSPYFMVDSQGTVESLPLESTRADIDVAGVIAHVKVTQTYRNRGSEPLEAVYVFPGSTRSAVFKMSMTIGDRTIEAQIKEKEAARKLYEQAKQAGKSASLLEQQRPNVFSMNVANIMPGDVIKVELHYSELLIPTDGTYELVYPTVVGPRYSGATGTGAPATNESWTKNPYLGEGKSAPYKFGLTARLDAGMPIAAINSPSHNAHPRFLGKTSAEIIVDDEQGGNRDFVLRYQLGGKGVQTGLLMFPGKDENFFLMMMQPPKRIEPSMLPAREYIFVLDVSGSMRGFPLNTAKGLITKLLENLRKQDRFNIMFFSGGNTVLSEESVPATPEWRQRATQLLTAQRGGGGTQILPAMQRALKMPRSKQMSTSIVVVTDGYVSVEKKTFDVIEENLGTANLFTFGIGSSVNRHLIEGMARVGMGEPFIVNGADADTQAEKFRRYIESPVLTNVKASFDGFNAYDVEPKSIPDVFAQRPVIVFGKYRGTPSGHISLSGYNGRGRWSEALAVNAGDAKTEHEALRQLWARHRIARLDDLATVARTGVKDEVTQLGLKYSLMTKYTSFVAIDSVVRNHQGNVSTVSQPLPLPQGVSNAAVGASPPAPMTVAPHGGYSRRMSRKRISGGAGRAMAAESAPSVAPSRPRPSPPPQMRSVDTATRQPASDEDASAEPEDKADEEKKDEGSDRDRLVALRRPLGKCVEGVTGANSVELRIEIGANGNVLSVRVVKGKLDAKVERCLFKTIKRRRFTASGARRHLVLPLGRL